MKSETGLSKVVALLLCMSLLLSACGGQKSGTSSPSGDKSNASSDKKSGANQTIELRVAHQSPETESIHKGFVKFKEVIEAANVGITVKIFPAAQLVGSDRDSIEGVKLGEIDLTSVADIQFAPHVDAFYAFNANYLFKDLPNAKEKLEGPAGKALKEAAAKKGIGVKVATFFGGSGRIFWNNVRAIKTVGDFKGIKARSAENPINVQELKTLGAIPTPMAWNELYTGLQQGTVDGLISSKAPILKQGLSEVLKYATDTNHSYYIPVILMSEKTYNKLNDAQKAAYEKAIKEATDHQWKLAIEEENGTVDQIRNLQKKGKITFTELTDAEREKFKAAFVSATESMVAEKCGKEILSMFR